MSLFSERLLLLRNQKGLYQSDIDVSQNVISKYEADINEPSLDNLVKSADYFGVSTDYLLGRVDDPA